MISIRIELWNSTKLTISNRKEFSTLYLRFLGRDADCCSRETSAYFVTEGADFFLIDCPFSTFLKAKNFDLSACGNFFVIITHTHIDNIGGLGLLAQYCFSILHKRLNILVPSEEIKNDIKSILSIGGLYSDWYNLSVIDPNIFYGNNNVCIEPILTKHSPMLDGKCFGYYIEITSIDENQFFDQSFVYTGDTSIFQPFEECLGFSLEAYVDVSVFFNKEHLHLQEMLPRLTELAKDGTKVYLMNLDNVKAAEKIVENIPNIEVVRLS